MCESMNEGTAMMANSPISRHCTNAVNLESHEMGFAKAARQNAMRGWQICCLGFKIREGQHAHENECAPDECAHENEHYLTLNITEHSSL